jgi:hypothetical protein
VPWVEDSSLEGLKISLYETGVYMAVCVHYRIFWISYLNGRNYEGAEELDLVFFLFESSFYFCYFMKAARGSVVVKALSY